MAAINAEQAIYALLRGAGYSVYTVLPSDGITYPAVQVQTAGGRRDMINASERLIISVIARRRQESSEIANSIHDMLVENHHFIPEHGLIDSIQSESTPVEIPYKDNLNKNIFNVVAYSRIF